MFVPAEADGQNRREQRERRVIVDAMRNGVNEGKGLTKRIYPSPNSAEFPRN
jgi:hypothetical protein